MPLTNRLKVQVDLPVWEWCRFNPIGNTAAACTLTTGDSGGERYLYYVTPTFFYRYDTVSDSWQQLATPPVAPATVSTTKYTSFGGNWGRVLGSGSSSITLPALGQHTYAGLTVRIFSGTGAGQDRVIGTPNDPVIGDQGLLTSVTGATQITDSTKKWSFNQWQGYYVHVEYGNNLVTPSGVQFRKILYNDQTNLYLSDTNYQAIDSFNNTGFASTAPYALPVATAGSQSMYSITSQVCPVTVAWTVQPDTTSRYVLLSGGFFLVSSTGGAPFYTMQYYDVLTDTWFTKTATAGYLSAALGTDVSAERTTDVGGTFTTGTATSATARTLTDSSQTLVQDRYTNYQLRLTGGTGAGQRRVIIANGTTYFEVERAFDVTPDVTTTYAVYGNSDNFYLFGNNAATTYLYSTNNDLLFQGKLFEYGIARTLAARLGSATNYSLEAIAITTATRNTGAVTAVAVNAGGINYQIGDILTLSTTGTLAKVIVTATTGGVITAVQLIASGSGYSTGSSATTGGSGTTATVTISTVGTCGFITTAINHFFKIGDSITFFGATEAAWNATYTITGVDSITTFTIVITATATAIVTTALSTTVLVDATKNWTAGEHVGKLVTTYLAGVTGAASVRRITANTATSLTMQTAITAAINGTGRYTINDISAIGKDRQYKQGGLTNQGYASSGSTTTLVDSSKTWTNYPPAIVGQWAGYRVRIVAGTGFGNEFAITSNTATTLTYSTQSFTPDTTTKYIIMDTYGLATGGSTTTLVDSTKVWTVNQWAGKRVRFTSGTGQGIEAVVTSNTANTLTFGVTTSPIASDTCYTLLGNSPRSTGISAQWIFGTTDTNNRGKYIVCPRGGGFSTFDKYDVTQETWEYGFMMQPQSETLTTGSMYTYDGTDTIYFTNNATGRLFALNVTNMRVQASGMVPYGMSTAVLSNRMETTITVDGLKYIYIMRHTGTEMWRTLVFW